MYIFIFFIYVFIYPLYTLQFVSRIAAEKLSSLRQRRYHQDRSIWVIYIISASFRCVCGSCKIFTASIHFVRYEKYEVLVEVFNKTTFLPRFSTLRVKTNL